MFVVTFYVYIQVNLKNTGILKNMGNRHKSNYKMKKNVINASLACLFLVSNPLFRNCFAAVIFLFTFHVVQLLCFVVAFVVTLKIYSMITQVAFIF